MPDILAAPSSEPGHEDFRTMLAGKIREYALDVTAGCPAEELARVMDEARVKFTEAVRNGEAVPGFAESLADAGEAGEARDD